MSDLLISDGEVTTTLPDNAEDKAKQLPDPVRFQILTVLPEIDEEYESGIVKSSQSIHYEEVLSPVLFVVNLARMPIKTQPDSHLAHPVR